ncbi:hypothetical protein [Mesorhizobium australicum]|uniref:hypothetical protein n=1 Tax=Mesorhizobium australicum TaxID=536018 RepID=UPI00333AD9EB
MGINDGAGQELELAAERELHEVGGAWPGRRKGEGAGAGAAPFGEFCPVRAMPVPEGGEIAVEFRQFAFDSGTVVAVARAVGSDNSVRVAPIGIVDRRGGKGKARKGLVEGRGELGVGRLRALSPNGLGQLRGRGASIPDTLPPESHATAAMGAGNEAADGSANAI